MDNTAVLRAKGCLLGHLAGDSLGGLVEFREKADIAEQYPDGVRKLADGGTWGLLAGQPTDDGELTLTLARSIARKGRYDPNDALDAYVGWLRSVPFDIGSTTSTALASAAARQHKPNPVSQANGSLMRVSPIGIFAAGQPYVAYELARIDSFLTHPNEVCRDACGVYAAAIAVLVAGGERSEAYRLAVELAKTPEVGKALADAERQPPADFQTNMGWVLIALQNAFHRLLLAPSYEEGVVATVMEGGDTDTNAAIAGALLGAAWGVDAIPEQWRTAVAACRPERGTATRHPRPSEFWPNDAAELAEQLVAAGSVGT